MQYGTVPIVASTGGLVDTVKEGVTGYHMGAMDADNLLPEDVDALVETCAPPPLDYTTPTYEKMSATCISQDLSWAEPAKKWEGVLEELYFGTPEGAKKAEVVVPTAKADQTRPRVNATLSLKFFSCFMTHFSREENDCCNRFTPEFAHLR